MATKTELLARHGIAVVDELPPETVAKGSDAAGIDTVSATARMPRVAPHDALRDAIDALDVAGFAARQCRDAVSASRQNFNTALNAWNATQPIQTVEDLKKEWIASNQAERVRRAEARQLQRPLTVGETARAMAGGNKRAGGGAAYRRGAYTRAEARTIEDGKMLAARMAGNIAPRIKLPSDR
jgi:hypothetical protein